VSTTTARAELDLAAILTAIAPGLSELLRPGKLDAITLSWRAARIPVIPRKLHEQALREPGIIHAMPGAPTDWCEDRRLMIDLTAQGEQFSFEVATADDDTDDLDLACRRRVLSAPPKLDRRVQIRLGRTHRRASSSSRAGPPRRRRRPSHAADRADQATLEPSI
jgi:hypothetical protein